MDGFFEISIRYDDDMPDPGSLVIARVENGRAEAITSYVRRDRGSVAAFVDRLGAYVLMRRTGSVTPDYGTGSLRVFQNAPNPFRAGTVICFDLPLPSRVEADVITVEGRLVRRLAGGLFGPGRHSLEWDGRDSGGSRASSGLYLYRVSAGPETATMKMILLR